MRVIGGKAKGHRLKKVPGDTTRPITDRVKESLFNILGNWVAGTRWLDLFAGTGQVGIEALSRGAEFALFDDDEKAAIRTIVKNLDHTKLRDMAGVIQGDAFRYLQGFGGHPFDAIFIAPPQYQSLWSKSLLKIDADVGRFLAPDGVVITQIDPRENERLELKGLVLVDERRYGNTHLSFYEPSLETSN